MTDNGYGSPDVRHWWREGGIVEPSEFSILSFRGAEGSDEILVVTLDGPRVIINCEVLRA